MKKYKLLRLLLLPLVVLGIFGHSLLSPPPAHALNFAFFEAPVEGGYAPWNHQANIATHNAWLATIGETPDYREDWEGNDWTGQPWSNGQVFDSQTTSAIFGGGATFNNVGPDPTSLAYTSNASELGGSQPKGNLAWRGTHNNQLTINFGPNLADYVGFYIFDADHPPDTKVTYHIQFSDGTIESIVGKNAYQNKYLFVGFVNTHASAAFEKFWIDAVRTSRYGIDELEWGSTNPIPEPSTVIILGLGVFGLFTLARRRLKKRR